MNASLDIRSWNTIAKFVETRNVEENTRAAASKICSREENAEEMIDARGSRRKREKEEREENGGVHASEKRIKGVTTGNVALTGNWTISFCH